MFQFFNWYGWTEFLFALKFHILNNFLKCVRPKKIIFKKVNMFFSWNSLCLYVFNFMVVFIRWFLSFPWLSWFLFDGGLFNEEFYWAIFIFECWRWFWLPAIDFASYFSPVQFLFLDLDLFWLSFKEFSPSLLFFTLDIFFFVLFRFWLIIIRNILV